jgi:hypothetical protein
VGGSSVECGFERGDEQVFLRAIPFLLPNGGEMGGGFA